MDRSVILRNSMLGSMLTEEHAAYDELLPFPRVVLQKEHVTGASQYEQK